MFVQLSRCVAGRQLWLNQTVKWESWFPCGLGYISSLVSLHQSVLVSIPVGVKTSSCFCRICQRLWSWHTTFTGVKRRLPVWCSVPDYIHGLSLFLSRQTGTWPASRPGFAPWENIVEEGISPTSLLAAVITLSITKTKKQRSAFHLCSSAVSLYEPVGAGLSQPVRRCCCCCFRARRAANGGVSFGTSPQETNGCPHFTIGGFKGQRQPGGRGLLTLQHTDRDELQWLFWVLIEPVVCVEVQHTNTTFVFKREKKEAQWKIISQIN